MSHFEKQIQKKTGFTYVLICCDIHQFSALNSKHRTKSNMSAVGKIPFFTNLQCESAMPWEELTNQLEIGIKRFSNGEIEQPVRAMLPITEHSGFLGKFFLTASSYCVLYLSK